MLSLFSQACENNKAPILAHIKAYLANAKTVLEIGSGTAQHAIHFAQNLPHVQWQTSDQQRYHAGINQNIHQANIANILASIEVDVRDYAWGEQCYDAVFSANTLHIMSEASALIFINNVSKTLNDKGHFMVYGPFNYGGQYSSESNARFDAYLKMQNSESGIRDFELLNQAAAVNGLKLINDHTMPANNRLLIWQKFDV